MQPYDKHTSRVKSWNYVNFLLESHLNSLDLDLGRNIEPSYSFLAEVRESQETWVPKSQPKPVQKIIYIQIPSVWSFSGIAHTQEKKKGVTACPPPGYQDQSYLPWFSPDLLYSHLSEKSTNWAMFPILVNFTNQVKIFCLIWRMLSKLSYSVRKTLFYETLTCTCMLQVIDYIRFWKNSICMSFGWGDCFTSLIGRNLA